jgi:hypothetical protein
MPWSTLVNTRRPKGRRPVGKRTVVPAGKQRVRVAEGIYLKASGHYLATFRDPGRRSILHRQAAVMSGGRP